MLRIYDVCVQVLRDVRPLADKIATADRNHASQLRRSALSVQLNVAEGSGCRGGNRRLKYEYALGSAQETLANLEAAEAIGYVPGLAPETVDRLRRVIGTLTKLVR